MGNRHVDQVSDSRCITAGSVIPSQGYVDQPYVVQTDDGAWLCVMTTAAGHEGQKGQHVVSLRSFDHGRTWSDTVAIEPADGPEASYAVLLKTPAGRVYCFYNHNSDNVRQVPMEDGNVAGRVDSLGHYVFKYSDDHGRTWSRQRYEVPVREFACDRDNSFGGGVRMFWNVGRPPVCAGKAYFTLHKVAALGVGFFAQSEGALLCSDNILSEGDPAKVRFQTLPDGDAGLRAPAGGGRIAEEQCVVPLSDGSLYCVYRTVDGHPACSYSRDGGHSWSAPQYKAYSPGGRLFKHPRAANFVWRCSNGQYLYWFHNHGGRSYDDRNPAWLCAGREIDTPDGKMLEWSQPEILLYDDDPFVRMSYPDLIEQGDGRFFVTETQKAVGRVHEIDDLLLSGLFGQWDAGSVASEGMLLELASPTAGEAAMPPLPAFLRQDRTSLDGHAIDERAGFSIELAFTLKDLAAGRVLLDSRDGNGAGVALTTTPRGTIELAVSDGRQRSSWDTDPGVVSAGRRHHIVATVDGGPRIITFLVDGVLCDGGEHRQVGWGRFSPSMIAANGSPVLAICPGVHLLRIYGRALRTSESVSNWQAWRAGLERK